MARAPISRLNKGRKFNHLIGYIPKSNFKFKFSNFEIQNNLLCLRVLLQNVFLKVISNFVFFVFILVDAFSGSIKTEKSQKTFLPWQKISSAKQKFRTLWRNFICGNEMGGPGRAVSLHLARLGSQSEHRIRRILPARGACHIII